MLRSSSHTAIWPTMVVLLLSGCTTQIELYPSGDGPRGENVADGGDGDNNGDAGTDGLLSDGTHEAGVVGTFSVVPLYRQNWHGFANPWRVWGKGVSPCASGDCSIIDWRLRQTDDQVRNRSQDGRNPNPPFVAGRTCPRAVHGDVSITDHHSFAYHRLRNGTEVSGDGDGVCEAGERCANTFLINAVEIIGDGAGDEDGLCESDERCIYSPNIGAYQGEGALLGPCLFEAGRVTGVAVYAYQQNGG